MAEKRKTPRLVADRRHTSAPPKKKKTAPASRRKPAARSKPTGGFLTRLMKSIFGALWRIVWGLFWRGSLIMGLILAGAVAYLMSTMPPVEQMLDGRARGSVTLTDRYGDVFAWRGDQFGGMVTADTVSPHLKNAIIATEDKRFYSHFGVSLRGISSAIRINLREGRGALSGHGGSTITQQTAKLLCLGTPYDPKAWKTEADYEADCRQGSLWRKVKEATYAIAMEAKYTKDEILTIYLNRAFLGAGARGFEAAAQRYFGHSAADVTPPEAAMLAGLLVAPTRYAPTNDLSRSQERARVIIGLMEEQGYISTTTAQLARDNPAELSEAAEAKAGGYFADWVMQSGPEYFTKNTTEDVIIGTTLDQRIQKSAEEALQFIFAEKVKEGSKAQAAIVVMSADGAVRAMVGGRKTKVAGAFNRATQALRQTGSSFKPFVYATALELGYSPMDTVEDAPYTINIPGSGPWSPRNYTKEFRGTVTLTDALANSLNIPAVKISEAVGRDNVRKVATDFGIASDLAVGPAIALGVSESTLIEMVGAYAGILNGGSSVTPYGLVDLRLLGDDVPLMGTAGGIGERVIRKEAAEQLIYMMNKVVTEGSGQRAQIPGWEIAGKTGTTQAARDAWFIGFNADYVTGVWMGYDDNTPLRGVTGGGLPAEIWHETMLRVTEGMTPTPLPMARNVAPVSTPVSNGVPAPQAPSTDGFITNLLQQLLGG